VVVTAAVWALPSPASAAPPVERLYRGETSAGDAVTLIATVRGDVVRFRGIGIEGAATCEDGSSVPLAHGFDLAPRGVRLEAGAFAVEHVTFSEAYDVAGTLGTRSGTGTITHRFAALDSAEEPVLCSTGAITWTVERVPVPARGLGRAIAAPAHASSAVIRGAEGVRLVEAGPSVRGPRLRSYEGRTSGGLPLFAVTSRLPAGVALMELGVSWELACEEGAPFGLGFLVLFAGEPLGPGRIDYDVAAPELAFHVNGTLDPHLGEGTTSATLPALTADLRAQACRSGDLTWRLWRIDAGARSA
jgi:hypothetical protein